MILSGPDDPSRPHRWAVWIDRGRGWESYHRKGGPKPRGIGLRLTITSDLRRRLEAIAEDKNITVIEAIDILEKFYKAQQP